LEILDEVGLIGKCLQNDRSAQKELVYHYAPALLTVVRRYVHDDHFAEDYLQEGFIQIFQNLHQYDPNKGKLFTWMRTIAIHAAIRHYKLEKKRLNGIQTLSETEADQIQDPGEWNQIMDCEHIIGLIQSLDDPYQKVFNLFVIDGFSHEEISGMIGINISNSRSILFRARQMLMQMLSAQKVLQYGK
jgi:RNA polymerase sigma-70 factor (ECF subfamily)